MSITVCFCRTWDCLFPFSRRSLYVGRRLEYGSFTFHFGRGCLRSLNGHLCSYLSYMPVMGDFQHHFFKLEVGRFRVHIRSSRPGFIRYRWTVLKMADWDNCSIFWVNVRVPVTRVSSTRFSLPSAGS